MTVITETPIELLHLPERTYNALVKADVNYVSDLLREAKAVTLRAIPGIGMQGEKIILDALIKQGYLG